jgi:cell division protein FtsB
MNTEYLNPLRWNKSLLISLLAACIVIWFLFFDTYSLMTKIQLENQKEDLIERTAEYERKAAELEKQIEELENNPDLIEKIAREDYGMKKPDETVYKVEKTE